MNKIKKKLICLILCMALVLGTASTAIASSGSATYGGATVKWSMSSSESVNKLSYKATAKMQIKGQLFVKNEITNIGKILPLESDIAATSSNTYTAEPGLFSSFVSNSSNTMEAYINGSCFITYHPQL